MATKYWVGGTGTWDGFTATNWSDTSGGPGGAIAPCALDDVVFNSASNATAYTVTISNNTSVCRDLTISGPASGNVTVTGSGALGIFGSLTLPATGITRAYTGVITFRATTTGKTITTNGISLGSNVTFNGTGGEWTLGSAFNTNGNVTFTSGTLTTANYNFTCASFRSDATGSGTINLGSSAVSCSQFRLADAVTLNAGTSSITCSATASDQFGYSTNTVGHTYYNLTQNNITASYSIFANNTFNNLTLATITSVLQVITLTGNQTINGTFTASGSGAIGRLMLQSNVIGTARTLTVGTVAALTDVDFRDITVAGASSPWSGTRLGDCGGNTNITFGAGVNKYWNLPAGGGWRAAAWATSSGGTADVLNFPLAQDTAIIENTGLNTSASISSFTACNVKTVDCSTRTNAFGFSGGPSNVYGDFILSTAHTGSAPGIIFCGRLAQNITSAGRTLNGVTVNNYGSTVTLVDPLTNGSTFELISGTFNTANQTLTFGEIRITVNSLSKTLNLGSSTVTCSIYRALSAGVSNFTLNAGTSTVTATATSFGIDGYTSTFNNLTLSTASATRVTDVSILGNVTVSGTLNLGGGTSVTQRKGIISDVAGTQRTITAATVSGLTDIDFRDIQGAGAGNWTIGTRLGDCGGNSGITFPAAKTVYWNLAGTQNWSSTAWATGSGGSPSANNFPLAQDTAVFDDTGAAGTVTINQAWNIGTISAGGRTSAMTFQINAGPSIYGDLTYGSGFTVDGSAQNFSFRKPGTQTFITAGKSLVTNITVDCPSCIFKHGDAYTSTGGANIIVVRGAYETQNYSISIGSLLSQGTDIRSISLGSSTVTVGSANTIQFLATNLTFNAGTSTINLSSTGTKSFVGGGQTFNTVTSTGGTTNALTISGSNTFTTLSNTAYTYLILTSGTTQTFTNFNYTGASGSVVRIYTTTPGLTATVQKASGAWYAGANSTDGGNNTGWTFTAGGSTDYVYLKDIIAAIGVGGAGGKFFYLF